eukprot:scaffold600_cov385-Prasinococcus_capsulatus_cf.AAC.20
MEQNAHSRLTEAQQQLICSMRYDDYKVGPPCPRSCDRENGVCLRPCLPAHRRATVLRLSTP